MAKSRNLDGALADYRKTVALFSAISSSDPNDADTRINLAAANSKIADVLVLKGNTTAAMETYGQVLSVVEAFAHSAPPNVQAQYTVADTYAGMGNAELQQAMRKSASTFQQKADWAQARSWFQKSFQEWRQVRNPGVMSPGGFDTAGPSLAAQKLAACDAALKQLDATSTTAHQ